MSHVVLPIYCIFIKYIISRSPLYYPYTQCEIIKQFAYHNICAYFMRMKSYIFQIMLIRRTMILTMAIALIEARHTRNHFSNVEALRSLS